MKIKDLIEELKKFPQDEEIYMDIFIQDKSFENVYEFMGVTPHINVNYTLWGNGMYIIEPQRLDETSE